MASRNGGSSGVEQLLFSVPQVAQALDLGTTYTRGLIRANALRSIRVGRRVLVTRADLEAFVANMRGDQILFDTGAKP